MSMQPEVSWFDTLTLLERASLLETSPLPQAAPPPDAVIHDIERRWRALPVLAEPKILDQRLASESLDVPTWRAALGLRPPDVGALEMPAWVRDLEMALGGDYHGDDLPLDALDRAAESIRFLPLVEPIIHHAFVKVRDGIAADLVDSPLRHFDPDAVAKLLVPALPGRMVMLIRRVLVLELNIARLEGTLHGVTPHQRFESFVTRLAQADEQRRIFTAYPVMARQVALRAAQWVEASREFVHHLADDWQELGERWGGDRGLGQLIDIKASLGDSHRGGRTVMRAGFDSGVRLVYKPRSLASEVHFNALLDWFNEAGFAPRFRTLAVLDRGDHGWVEMVATRPCSAPEEADRFYQRQGAFVALLYALNANDFHYENIVASGEDPVLVDLETLFLPRITGQPAGSEPTFLEAMKRSVMTSGLLPQRGRLSAGEGVSDLSGMTDIAGQKTWAPMLAAVEQGTDHMRFERLFGEIPGSDNTPSIQGSRLIASDYTEAIAQGFEKAYRLMMDRRAELLAPEGPIAAFADCEMRLVFRPTRVYASLLFESFHPDVLHNALDRDMLFDHLWWAIEDGPFMAPLLAAERRDLLNVDVPIFTARPGATAIRDSTGQAFDGIIAESGLTVVRHIIAGFSERDLSRQRWLVRATLATLDLAHTGIVARPDLDLSRDRPPVTSDRLLDAADTVAEQLGDLAYEDSRRACWYGFEYLEHPHWSLRYADAGLYEGLAGIALFLAYHGVLRDDQRSMRLARGALTAMLGTTDRVIGQPHEIGAFSGQAGVLYTLLHLGVLWNDPALLDRAEQLVPELVAGIAGDEANDIVSGSAGCLAVLLELAAVRPSAVVAEAARACGDHLLATAKPCGQGIGWPLAAAGSKALAGFSHGAAGIAWTLLRLHAACGDRRYREAARAAVAFERGLYDPRERNWPDLREGHRGEADHAAGETPFLVAWCHGAPGILLARLLSLAYLDEPALRQEIDTALTTTLEAGFDSGHCLCHGALGNTDILLVASQILGRPDLAAYARRLMAGILDDQAARGWRYGVPGKLTPPGLMVGLAGFGYQLLRTAHSGRVPSVLALAAPPA